MRRANIATRAAIKQSIKKEGTGLYPAAAREGEEVERGKYRSRTRECWIGVCGVSVRVRVRQYG